MCGICGVIGISSSERSETVVRQMTAAMRHRGPDDEGRLVEPPLALGMRRLSIIDLQRGHQPVFNEDGTVAVVLNGEIYNFQDLRRTLQSRGHAFRTLSDTEAIVHAYEEWGPDCVDHFEGMFAFAVAETTKQPLAQARSVLLARDRVGIKPLYYSLADGVLLFASEVRALLASGLVKPRLSIDALRSYLLFGSVAEPMTLIEGVFALPPGHRVLLSPGSGGASVQPQAYWDFAQAAQSSGDADLRRQNSPRESLRDLLETTVARHLIADVPLGVFLSSGIDSTALVALAARQKADVHTLTVVFPEQEYSEATLARQTAQRFKTRHQELLLTGEQMLERLNEAVAALDQPSMDGINTYFVSWAARQAGLKVALSGLGGDEIFGGYGTFRQTPRAQSLAALARWIPGTLRSASAAVAERVGNLGRRDDARRKLLALWRQPEDFPHPYFFTRLLFTPAQAAKLTGGNGDPATSGAWGEWAAQTAWGAQKLDSFTSVSCLEARSYMLNTLLRDTDSMSMAHSLEVRVPLLDHLLIEFVGQLPERRKRVNGVPKALLVRALEDLLPQEVVCQKKRTFTLPWERWLRGALRAQVEAGVADLSPALARVLDAGAVRRVWTDFLEGRTTWSRAWSLFVLNDWAKRHELSIAE